MPEEIKDAEAVSGVYASYVFKVMENGDCKLSPPANPNPAHISMAIGTLISLLVDVTAKATMGKMRETGRLAAEVDELRKMIRRGQPIPPLF